MNPIVIPGQPVSTNAMYGRAGRGVYLAGEARAWKEAVAWAAKAAWKARPRLLGRLEVSLWYFFADRHRRDIGNYEKLTVDALQGICFKDDSQIDGLHQYRRLDPKRPRVEIVIKELV